MIGYSHYLGNLLKICLSHSLKTEIHVPGKDLGWEGNQAQGIRPLPGFGVDNGSDGASAKRPWALRFSDPPVRFRVMEIFLLLQRNPGGGSNLVTREPWLLA